MIAHLPMYDVPGNGDAHGRLWKLFFEALGSKYMSDGNIGQPPNSNIFEDWLSPNLLLSQTCGLPFRARLHDQVTLIATPDNQLDGCPAGHYRSAIIARKDKSIDLSRNDFTFAYNEALSQSGWGAPWADGITGTIRTQTGSHANSAKAVYEGHADVAAIDALTWHFLQRDWTKTADLHVIHWTTPTPTLPYITAKGIDPAPIRSALAQAINALSQKDNDTLQLYGLIDISVQDYLAQPIPPLP